MSLSIEVKEGTEIPKFYGITYHDFSSNCAVCHPIPFNIIIAAWKGLIWYLRIVIPKRFMKPYYDAIRVAEQRGFKKGMEM